MTDQSEIDTSGSEEADASALAPEEAARALGWKPKEEFKGPADKWTDAEAFLAKRDDHVGVLKDNVKRLERRVAELTRSVSKADRAGFERAMHTILERQRQAVESGDLEAFDKAEKERRKLEAQPDTPADADEREERWIEWQADNDWFGSNRVLTEYAGSIGQKILKESGKRFLDHDDLNEVSRRVKDRFGSKYPEAFGIKPAKADESDEDDQPKRRGSPVGAVPAGRGKGAPKSAADLDARGRELGQKMVSMGIYKDLNEYAKELFKNG